jgi:hypothetical protein
VLLGNATLTRVALDAQDDYGSPTPDQAAPPIWTGAVPCQVITRELSQMQTGDVGNRTYETHVWIPARLQANDGSYLDVQIGYYVSVVQDGQIIDYAVSDISDQGIRLIGTPSDVRLIVARRGT